MARKKSILVHGVGINDSDYDVLPTLGSRRVMCPFYRTWANMLNRCYSEKYHLTRPTYIGCKVADEWLLFSNFKKWMENQDWQGSSLDKDLIVPSNKVYSPETCAFVSASTNNFVTDRRSNGGKWPIGIRWHEPLKKFQSLCHNPITGEREHLGYFSCPDLAGLAWKARKHELANQLADMQSDERVAAALRTRYL